MNNAPSSHSSNLPDAKESAGNRLGEYQSLSVQRTLDNSFVPPSIREARALQDQLLKEKFEGKNLAFADIGCGNGYHGEIFGPSSNLYHGFEISSAMAQQSREKWAGVPQAQVIEGDASQIDLKPETYDVAWSLYFTSGNFRQEFDDIAEYDDDYLNENPAFIGIVERFYKALKKGGKLLLTVYKDLPETEAAQREFYQKTGQNIITPVGSRFVATAENFWSVRWTKESMLSNLAACGISEDQVAFNDLNGVSWLVEVTKPLTSSSHQAGTLHSRPAQTDRTLPDRSPEIRL